VDTLTVASALWRNPTLRSNVVEQAQKYQLPSSGDETSIPSAAEAAQAIRDLNFELSRDLQLSIGWQTEFYQLQTGEACGWLPQRTGDIWGIPSQKGYLQLKEPLPNQSAGPLAKLLGLLLTALAISQGAPFWFDLLSKVSNSRSTGAVPASSQENRKENIEKKGAR